MSEAEAHRTVRILLVEDNPGDVHLIRSGLAAGPLQVELDVVEDGVEALAHLRREGQYVDAQIPDMILLDLSLPRLDGHQVLATLKSDPELRRIPVCILSSSADDDDILGAYDRHANSYVCKPMELDDFLDTVRQIERFWLSVAALPKIATA